MIYKTTGRYSGTDRRQNNSHSQESFVPKNARYAAQK